jgi:hypothetical protein
MFNWLQLVSFAIIAGVVQYIVRYFAEKGKNRAMKQDIEGITEKIESVKESYNKSLENHKIELQKEFESHKYILKLCQSLDNKLISLVSECLEAYISNSLAPPPFNDKKLISATMSLSSFLTTYENRYNVNITIKKLITISNNIHVNSDMDEPSYKLPDDEKQQLILSLNKTISLFLPPFKIEKKPEH